MYADVAPSRTAGHVRAVSQSNAGVPEREATRTATHGPESVGDAAAGLAGAGPAGEEDEGCGCWSWRPLNSSSVRRSIA